LDVWHYIPDLVPRQGGEYAVYVDADDYPIPPYVIPFFEVYAWDWLTTREGGHYLTWNASPGYNGFNVQVSANSGEPRSDEVSILYWYEDWSNPPFWEYRMMGATSVGVSQDIGSPTSIDVEPNPIEVPDTEPDTYVETTWHTNMGDFDIQLKYKYEGGAEQVTGTYPVDSNGNFSITYSSSDVRCCAGDYEITAIRMENGTWNPVSLMLTLKEPDLKPAFNGLLFPLSPGSAYTSPSRWVYPR
jgi:hypothetical protein